MSILNGKKDLDCQFDGDNNRWLVRVPHVLSPAQKANVQQYIIAFCNREMAAVSKTLQPRRHASFEKGLAAAKLGNIFETIIKKGDIALFEPTARANPDKTFHFVGGSNG